MIRPRICTPIPCRSVKVASKLAEKAYQAEVDLVEFRLDYAETLFELEEISKIRASIGIPAIATARSKSQGGFWRWTEALRIKLLAEAVELGFEYVDLEIEVENLPALTEKFRKKDARVIVSYHNFKSTPSLEQLRSLYASMRKLGCDIGKIAVKAENWRDSLTMLEFNLEASKLGKVVGLSMGPYGLPARILAPLYGAEFTYASLDPTLQTAPGQITVDKLQRIYEALGL